MPELRIPFVGEMKRAFQLSNEESLPIPTHMKITDLILCGLDTRTTARVCMASAQMMQMKGIINTWFSTGVSGYASQRVNCKLGPYLQLPNIPDGESFEEIQYDAHKNNKGLRGTAKSSWRSPWIGGKTENGGHAPEKVDMTPELVSAIGNTREISSSNRKTNSS